jgi:hypothetical protein
MYKLWRYVPSALKSNEWIINEKIEILSEQDMLLKIHADLIRYEEDTLKKQITRELEKTRQQVDSSQKATELEHVIALSRTYMALSRTRQAYMDASAIIHDKQQALADFYAKLIIKDAQTEVDQAMRDIVFDIDLSKLKSRLSLGKSSRVKMDEITNAVKDACKIEHMTEEQKKTYEDDCLGAVRDIASNMGRLDLVTSLDKIRDDTGQFTALKELEILPDIEVSKRS